MASVMLWQPHFSLEETVKISKSLGANQLNPILPTFWKLRSEKAVALLSRRQTFENLLPKNHFKTRFCMRSEFFRNFWQQDSWTLLVWRAAKSTREFKQLKQTQLLNLLLHSITTRRLLASTWRKNIVLGGIVTGDQSPVISHQPSIICREAPDVLNRTVINRLFLSVDFLPGFTRMWANISCPWRP